MNKLINKIVRRPDRAEGGITPEELELMKAHSAIWIKRAFRTEPINKDKITAAVKELYKVSGLKEPKVIIVPSPLVMAIAGSFSSILLANKTYDATRVATHAATRDATDAATLNKGWALEVARKFTCNSALISLLLQECSKWYSYYQGGNMWPAYDCYLTAARDILGLKLPIHDKYKSWEQCAIEGGFRFMHKDFCMVSDFPTVLKIDENNRPHCEDGPSHLWRDGWALFYWHGIKIPDEYRWLITNPEKITPEFIDKEENAEYKRIMIERFGMAKYLESGNAKLIDESIEQATGNIRQLYKKTLVNGIDALFLKLINSTPEPDGTRKEYIIPVHPECCPILHDDSLGKPQKLTALNAVASTFGLYGHEYCPQIET